MSRKTRVRAQSQSFGDVFLACIKQVGEFVKALRIIGPVYLISIGLIAAYAWGWTQTIPGVFGVAMAAFVAAGELLKPILGPLIEDRLVEHKRAKAFALIVVGLLTVGFGGVSSFVAFNAAAGPQIAYDAGQRTIHEVEQRVVDASTALARFDCPADMPASRCERNRAANADSILRASHALDAANTAATVARTGAPRKPAIQFPPINDIVKFVLGLGLDFVLFVTPWAAREKVHVAIVVEAIATPIAEAAPPAPTPVKLNDGGWATRRARYGASGLKRKGGHLRLVREA